MPKRFEVRVERGRAPEAHTDTRSQPSETVQLSGEHSGIVGRPGERLIELSRLLARQAACEAWSRRRGSNAVLDRDQLTSGVAGWAMFLILAMMVFMATSAGTWWIATALDGFKSH